MPTIDLPDPPFAIETEETIRERLLDGIDDAFNKDEGDVIFDLLTPAAIEIDMLYDSIEASLEQCFVATATSTYLDAHAATFSGLVRLTNETDDAFRTRILARIGAPPGAGNESDFRTWALTSSADVAYVHVEPLWAGDGTVRIFAGQPDRSPCTAPMLTALDAFLVGFTPIGFTVTTAASTALAVTLVATVEMKSNYPFSVAVEAEIAALVTDYVEGLPVGVEVVRNEIIAAILAAEGVYDVATLTLNGVAADLAAPAPSALAVVNTITVTEG